MSQQVLFILVGASLYAAIQQWLEAARPDGRVALHILAGLLCLLAAAMGSAAWLTGEVNTPQGLLLTGAVITGLGMLSWALLPWLIASFTHTRAQLLLAANSSLWGVLFIANLFATPSLLYAGWRVQAGGGTAAPVWEAVMNPAWWLVELAMIATLAGCGLMLRNHYREHRLSMTLAMGPALVLLALATLWDLLVLTRLVSGPLLTVTAFLFAAPLAAVVLSQQRRRAPRQAEASDASRRPVLLPVLPLAATGGTINTPAPATPREAEDTTPALLPLLPADRLPVKEVAAEPRDAAPEVAPAEQAEPIQTPTTEEPAVVTDEPRDSVELNTLQEHLNDISVYSHMLLGRLERGQWDPKSLQVLCKRLNSEARQIREVLDQHPDDSIDLTVSWTASDTPARTRH